MLCFRVGRHGMAKEQLKLVTGVLKKILHSLRLPVSTAVPIIIALQSIFVPIKVHKNESN
jgi:hypothetical protein